MAIYPRRLPTRSVVRRSPRLSAIVAARHRRAHPVKTGSGLARVVLSVVLAMVVGTVAAGSLLAMTGMSVINALSAGLPDPTDLDSLTFAQPTIIYDRTGTVELARFQREARRVVSYDEVPQLILDATTTAEDRTFWKNDGFDPASNRIVLSEIRRRIVEDSGVFADGDMIPLPCNPASISIGYGLRDGEKVIPLTSLVPREALLPSIPNAISFEKYPELRQRFVDLLSLSTADTNTAERLGSLLCCLPDVPMPEGSGYENVFRVTIVEFLDRFNFCLGNVKRSCVHFVTPDGAIIPFDTYNTFYRKGAEGADVLARNRANQGRAIP